MTFCEKTMNVGSKWSLVKRRRKKERRERRRKRRTMRKEEKKAKGGWRYTGKEAPGRINRDHQDQS